jgi:translocator protein
MFLTKHAKLAVSILACLAAGIMGSAFTFQAISGWYSSLIKPFWTPPSWAFGPVWTVLYILMGISLYLVWSAKLADRKSLALSVFVVQLALNVSWSVLFFGLRSPLLGFAGIIALWVLIVATIILFSRISMKAALLLLPYIIWVTIAACLNFSVWMLNAV